MSRIEECLDLTKELIDLANSTIESNRDQRIQEISNLLEKREELISFLHGPYSEEERSLGKQLVLNTQALDQALKNIHLMIKKDINLLEQKKKTAERYSNPYAATEQLDGMFYDKRK